jgi:S-formylglutathione hydrolase FrmB
MSGALLRVNVLVPRDYSSTASAPYSVLYLLHGHGGAADDWWRKADANRIPLERIVGNRRLIVVMPDGGYDGWYSDWYGIDVDGHNGSDPNKAPAWETFHIDELIPFIDRHYRSGADRTHRLIAGLSMGGFGAMSYAARHARLFAAAGSFSGALDIRLDDPAAPLVQPVAQNLPDRKLVDNCIWGDDLTQHETWVAHNPADQVARLESQRMAVYVSSGDGCSPSTANPDLTAPAACQSAGLIGPNSVGAAFTEWGVRQQSESFRQKLEAFCLSGKHCGPRQYDFYSPGVHDWPFWLGELGKFLRWAGAHRAT